MDPSDGLSHGRVAVFDTDFSRLNLHHNNVAVVAPVVEIVARLKAGIYLLHSVQGEVAGRTLKRKRVLLGVTAMRIFSMPLSSRIML